MTLAELFSEWRDMGSLMKGNLIGSTAIVAFGCWAFFCGEQGVIIGIIFIGVLLMIISICALRLNNNKE
jgi:hypothetical protein